MRIVALGDERRRAREESAAIRFSGVTWPNATNTRRRVCNPQVAAQTCRARPARSPPARRHAGTPMRIVSTRTSGYCFAQVAGDAGVVHRDQPGGAEHDGQHGPEVIDRPAQPFDRVLLDAGRRLGMVVAKLPAVVVRASLAQQVPGARVVEARIVQDDEARIGREVRPHVVVPAGVAELVDDEVVGRPLVFPDEVVRVEHAGTGHPGRRRPRRQIGRSTSRPGRRAAAARRRCTPRCRTGRAGGARTTRRACSRVVSRSRQSAVGSRVADSQQSTVALECDSISVRAWEIVHKLIRPRNSDECRAGFPSSS